MWKAKKLGGTRIYLILKTGGRQSKFENLWWNSADDFWWCVLCSMCSTARLLRWLGGSWNVLNEKNYKAINVIKCWSIINYNETSSYLPRSVFSTSRHIVFVGFGALLRFASYLKWDLFGGPLLAADSTINTFIKKIIIKIFLLHIFFIGNNYKSITCTFLKYFFITRTWNTSEGISSGC